MDWITNNGELFGAIITLVAGWLGFRKSDQNKVNLKNLAISRINQEYQRIIHDPASWSTARELLTDAAWTALGEFGVMRTDKTWALAIALTVDELLSRLQEIIAQRNLSDEMGKMLDRAVKLESSFKPPERPTVPGLSDIATVQVICAEPECSNPVVAGSNYCKIHP